MSSRDDSRQGNKVSAEYRFDQVYYLHHQAVQAYLYGRVGDHETALDLLQETFLRIWRHRQTLCERDETGQRVWLFAIARNAVIDHYRRNARRSVVEERLISQQAASPQPENAADIQAEEADHLRDVETAIQRLPEDLRTVLVMQVLGQLSSTEIGEVLSRPAGTIRYQIALARKQLAEQLRLVENEGMNEEVRP